jgi:hypothetical protein
VVGLRIWKGLQQHTVDHAEHRRVGADANGEGHDGDGRERRQLEEPAKNLCQAHTGYIRAAPRKVRRNQAVAAAGAAANRRAITYSGQPAASSTAPQTSASCPEP